MTDLTAPSWTQPELAIDHQLALTTAATRLAAEFDGLYGRETIERFLHSSYEQFATVGNIPNFAAAGRTLRPATPAGPGSGRGSPP
jgi:arsenate reductase (thioredoxin)